MVEHAEGALKAEARRLTSYLNREDFDDLLQTGRLAIMEQAQAINAARDPAAYAATVGRNAMRKAAKAEGERRKIEVTALS